MKYPTPEEVDAADREQLGRWMRFLPSPGSALINGDRDEYVRVVPIQREILVRINVRFQGLGGWDSDLSKRIGWGQL